MAVAYLLDNLKKKVLHQVIQVKRHSDLANMQRIDSVHRTTFKSPASGNWENRCKTFIKKVPLKNKKEKIVFLPDEYSSLK